MITGFPGSGTSLMGGLVYELGVPMGPLSSLKMLGKTNPAGYYEHRNIWDAVELVTPSPYHGYWNCGVLNDRREGKLRCNMCNDELTDNGKILPDSRFKKPKFDPTIVELIEHLAQKDNIVAVKHASFPLIHEYFPHIKKCIVINRSAADLAAPTTSIDLRFNLKDLGGRNILRKTGALEKHYVQPSLNYWRSTFDHIVRDKDIETMEFLYKDWKFNFNNNIDRLAKFLGVELTSERKQACKDLLVFR